MGTGGAEPGRRLSSSRPIPAASCARPHCLRRCRCAGTGRSARGARAFRAILVIRVQARFIVVDENGSRDVHGIDQHQAFIDTAFPEATAVLKGLQDAPTDLVTAVRPASGATWVKCARTAPYPARIRNGRQAHLVARRRHSLSGYLIKAGVWETTSLAGSIALANHAIQASDGQRKAGYDTGVEDIDLHYGVDRSLSAFLRCLRNSPVVLGMMPNGLMDHFPLALRFSSRTLIHGVLMVAGFGQQLLVAGPARRFEFAGFAS